MRVEKKIEYLEKVCKKYFLKRHSLIKDITANFNLNDDYLPDFTVIFKVDKKQFLDRYSDIKDREIKKTINNVKSGKTPFNIELLSDFPPFDDIEIQTYKLADSIGIEGEFLFIKVFMV